MTELTDHYTTHPEYLALLRGILENPDDDAPRGIIADWIQESGERQKPRSNQ